MTSIQSGQNKKKFDLFLSVDNHNYVEQSQSGTSIYF